MRRKIQTVFDLALMLTFRLNIPVIAKTSSATIHSSKSYSTPKISTPKISTPKTHSTPKMNSLPKSYSPKASTIKVKSYVPRTKTRKVSLSKSSTVHYRNNHIARDVSTSLKQKLKEQAGVGANNQNYIIDHIVALENGGTNDSSNLQVLSKAQHEIKTKRDNALRRMTQGS